ncbi:MAG: hypothetical protein ABEL76_10990 [Bradymonadaceae bacterium]
MHGLIPNRVSGLLLVAVLGSGLGIVGCEHPSSGGDDSGRGGRKWTGELPPSIDEFLDHRLPSVSLRNGILHGLAERVAESRVEIGSWKFDESTPADAPVFKLSWVESNDVGDEGRRRRAVFRFRPSSGRVKPLSAPARRLYGASQRLETADRAPVLPTTFKPGAREGEPKWDGKNRKVCRTPVFQRDCRATEMFLGRERLVESLRWFVGGLAGDVEVVRTLRSRGACAWRVSSRLPESHEHTSWADYRVEYHCDDELGISWSLALEDGRIVPADEPARFVSRVARVGGEDGESRPASPALQTTRAALRRAAEQPPDEE